MHTQKFKIEVPDWTRIDISNAKMILDEGQDYLKYLAAGSDKVTNRAFAIMAILIPVTSALIAIVLAPSVNPSWNGKFIHYMLGITTFMLISLMFGLGTIVFPRLYMPSGTIPKEICTQDFLGLSLDPELARLALVLGKIESCQTKIDFNETQLHRRTTLLKRLLIALGCLLTGTIISAFLFLLLR